MHPLNPVSLHSRQIRQPRLRFGSDRPENQGRITEQPLPPVKSVSGIIRDLFGTTGLPGVASTVMNILGRNQAVTEKPPLLKELPLLAEPIGVLDVGSNQVKTLVRLPNGATFESKHPITLGDSLGEHGHITPQARWVLDNAFQEAHRFMEAHGVKPENKEAVATEGLRAAGDAGAKTAQELGVKIIDGQTECRYVHKSVMRNQTPKKGEGLVIEVGGGSTEWALADDRLSRILPLGTGRNTIKNPFDASAIQALRENLRKQILPEITEELKSAAHETEAFMSPKKELKKVRLALFNKNLRQGPFTVAEINYCLTQEGLDRIRNVIGETSYGKKLPIKLSLLAESMAALGFDEINFGAPGGMKVGVMHEVILKKTAAAAQ